MVAASFNDASAAANVRTPKSDCSFVRCASPGSTTMIESASRPLLIKPPMMAAAMLPPPMNASVLFMVLIPRTRMVAIQ